MTHAKAPIKKSDVVDEISKLITQITGNQFNEKQKSMVELRLQKRCLELKIQGLENYYHYFKAHQQNEINSLVSLLTTHHTFFFREFLHFQYLEDHVLAALIPIVRQRPDKKIRIWSAACSKGHEVYSLAMFFDFMLKQLAPDLSYHILGSDIDAESLTIAHNGVYSRKDIKEVPMNFLDNHWDRGAGEISDFVKVKNSLKANVSFKKMNLLSIPDDFTARFDIIFCRNVFIYFDANQVKASSIELIKHLEPHGYYFIGISESLTGLNLPLVSRGPSIYTKLSVLSNQNSVGGQTTMSNQAKQKPVTTPASASKLIPSPTPAAPVAVAAPSPTIVPFENLEKKSTLRVLCVDDSVSILSLLGKILSPEEGFEVVGTANDGSEIAEKIRTLKPDIITLDIHMPNQTGVEYLQKNFYSGHPPVVMVSSVSREESNLALQALQSGASDYVEKPALSNIRDVSDEIRRKLRSAYRSRLYIQNKNSLKLDESFQKSVQIQYPHKFIRIILAQLSDKARLQAIIKECGKQQPPTFILLDGAKDTLEGFAQTIGFRNKTVGTWPTQALQADEIFIADAKQFSTYFSSRVKEIPASILIMGEVSPNLSNVLENWKQAQILVEDLGPKSNGHSPFRKYQTDIVPVTSFAYMSVEFLSKIKI